MRIAIERIGERVYLVVGADKYELSYDDAQRISQQAYSASIGMGA